MRKCLVISVLILFTAVLSIGCRSMGGCWSRNGSRVPTQTYAAPAQSAPVVMQDQVIYGGNCNPCAAVTNACDPCSTNACDPCGTSGQAANYAPLPGLNQ